VNASGLCFGGWIANHRVPEVFARHLMTVHVPRRPYARALPGIPTIRVFEALASGIPLVSAPWLDTEGLFRSDDFLRVRNGQEARAAMRRLRDDPAESAELARRGRETILARHTCEHRARELLAIARSLGLSEHQHGVSTERRLGEQSAWG
jgi:spore maturation protein CgeB